MPDLTERQKLILKAIIQEYVTNIEPISSKLLNDKYKLGISSATIRNEMAALEKLDYLNHPHTSAGRIPTAKGYRLYVDSLLNSNDEHYKLELAHKKLFKLMDHEIEDVLQEATKLLSEITNYISIMLLPPKDSIRIKHFSLLKLAPNVVLMIAIGTNGKILKERIELEKGLSDQVLQKIENIINKLYAEKHASVIKKSIKPSVRGLGLPDECDIFFNRLTSLFDENDDSRIFVEGLSKIAQQPNFKNLDSSQELLVFFGNKTRMLKLVNNISKEDDLTIRIGNEISEIPGDCSFIGAEYYYSLSSYGTLGLIGPCHMNYPRAISAVRFFTASLSAIFEKIV